jgi:hypothetical protein
MKKFVKKQGHITEAPIMARNFSEYSTQEDSTPSTPEPS